MEITYWSNDPLSSKVIDWFRKEKARHALTSLTLTPTMNNPLVSFGRGGSHVLPPMRYVTEADVADLFKTLFESKVLFFDIETHNAELKHNLPRDEFVRLVQWAWGARGEVQVSTNVQDLIDQFDKAELIVAHNGHAFDFGVTMGNDALDLAAQRRLFDTMVYANLVVPAPDKFTDRNGRTHTQWMGGQPKIVPHSMKWLSLDNLCYQLGLGGKLGDLQELAKKHNPPKTPVSKLDYSLIPTDDPEFLAYAGQDIHALRDLYYALVAKQEPAEYDWREQFKIAIDAQMSRNGFKVDTDLATRRIKEAEERKSRLLARLQAEYGLPSEGKSPWATTAGKAAQIAAIQAMGIDPYTHPGWPQGKTGPSLGKDPILAYVPDKEFAEALVQLKGDRGLAQQALEYVGSDGKVHIEITALQRSGRKSVSKPSLGTWSAQGAKAKEKEYFIPDSPDELLVELDFSNADARAVAAMSGDPAYQDRVNLSDAHTVTAKMVFGEELHATDPAFYRQKAKAASLGWGYRMRAKRMSASLDITPEWANKVVSWFDTTYSGVVRWQERATELGERDGHICNAWGRRMVIDTDETTGKSRAFTQAPALLGQSTTTEILTDALIRLYNYDKRFIRWLKVTIHDAVVFSIPKSELDWSVPKLVELLTFKWKGVDFPVAAGEPAENWWKAGH